MEEEKKVTSRNSSLELLRIICMFFIVFHHFMLHCAFPQYEDDILNHSETAIRIAMFLNGYFCIAVNCFILISGYFGIRFKVKGFLKLYFICAFYSLLGYFFHLYLDGAHIGRSILDYSLFALSNSKWWFINCYMVLFFTAPLLNKAIDSLSKSQYLKILILLTIVNVYFGFFGGQNGYNQYGYCVGQFVYLYVIGGYLRRFVSLDEIRRNRKRLLLGFVAFSLLIGLLANVAGVTGGDRLGAYYYNNPLVLLSSIAFFCFMLTFHFHSRLINCLAGGALAVYLFQDQPFIGPRWLYPSIKSLLLNWESASFVDTNIWAILSEFVFLSLFSLCFVLVILLFDQFRMALMRPIWSLIDWSKNRFVRRSHA